MIPLIALEEHFLSQEMINTAEGMYSEQLKWLDGVRDKLDDIGPLRISEMDKGGVTMQIVSHAPIADASTVALCTAANKQLYEAVQANPDRFAGFAVLPMADPVGAAGELRRCVKEFGFVGTLIDNHVNGQHYEGDEYLKFWKTAEELDVPVYLHPTWPSEDMVPRYEGNFSTGAALSIGSSGFGWHADTQLHVLKLFASGLFDKCPKLKLIIGHMGEMIPFQLERITYISSRWGNRKRSFQEVYDNNIWITTSGVWSLSPMACILRNTKIDKILFSIDYPFAQNIWGLKFMEDLESSGMVTKEQFEMIGYKNAENLLKVKVAGIR
ncbi:amidohydrolase 2 [Pseudovirgaria hyperparasitica]|uniref:Amidohydrolase 2 n=1 Tax=Pseudovirgaria hyperparasitica TaxID=470096 RepID=A0A6A6WGA3_9PEZI|nr:amidohydrolase 2 [Pseudovirgaria hyperparasitica]KAF2760657.1 amidohydrolase 2 [Pseudovirgaria hyperparasitica]